MVSSNISSKALPRSEATTTGTIGGPLFDSIFIGACIWFMAGAYSDAWAHQHIPLLEDFFTPWHGALYSGFLITTLVLVGTVCINRVRGTSWREAVPDGYGLALLGIGGFFIGGVGDGFWHTFFGFEKNIDAQFSPPHMLLLICTCFFLSGPYRALYRRSKQDAYWYFLLPASVILLFVIISLNTMVAHPYTFLWPTTTTEADTPGQTLAVISMYFQASILVGVTLYTIQRWKLFPGFFAITYTIAAIPMSFMQDHYIVIPIALTAGILTDVLYAVLRPSVERLGELRIFAASLPIIHYTVYFIALMITSQIVWSIHLSVGSVIVSGMVGIILSYAFQPAKR